MAAIATAVSTSRRMDTCTPIRRRQAQTKASKRMQMQVNLWI
jgi:hypothetical protein